MVEWEAHVEEAVNSTASPDIHSRCWLDLVEPGPAALGVGFSCLFLQVWCLMLIPPHVPWVLSKHAGAGDSAGKAALPPAHPPPPAFLYFYLPSWPTHPPALQYCDERLLFLSLPVIRAAMLNPYPPESLLPLRSFFPLYSTFSIPSDFCLLLALNPFDKGLCSHCSSVGSGALLQSGKDQLLLL